MNLEAWKRNQGVSLLELLSTIAIIFSLASLLLGSLYSAREKSKQAKCINNLKNLTAAMILSANDHDQFPLEIAMEPAGSGENPAPFYAWADFGDYYYQQVGITQCPKVMGSVLDNPPVYSYALNQLVRGVNLSIVHHPSQVIVAGESDGLSLLGVVDEVAFRHFTFSLMGFADGHVESVRLSELENALANYYGSVMTEESTGFGIVRVPGPFGETPEADIPFSFTDDSVCSNGFRWDFSGLQDNGDGTSTFTFVLTNSNRHGLIYTAFEMPEGVTAVSPPDGGTYIGTQSSYQVQNTATQPFRSVKFHTIAVGQGIRNGQSDTFTFALNNEDLDLITTMRVQAKGAQIIGSGEYEAGPPGTGDGGCS